MAGMFYGVVNESEASSVKAKSSLRASKRLRMQLAAPFKLAADSSIASQSDNRRKIITEVSGMNCVESCESKRVKLENQSQGIETQLKDSNERGNPKSVIGVPVEENRDEISQDPAKYGMTSVCGRRRDMEDTVSAHPSFCEQNSRGVHFFGVFDGHGCSHVAVNCKARMHSIMKEEMESCDESLMEEEWKETMEKSYDRMDKEVNVLSSNDVTDNSNHPCRCELQAPQCETVGSTAIVSVVTPDKIIVSNCGDSRAILCRNGVAIPLSVDQKPNRPDELKRIEDAGGRVIYWDGHRVLGVLAMSRAIGDSYLKPYVISEPEVSITDRTEEDECLILASDGLWDVVSNETACGVARMCLQAQRASSSSQQCRRKQHELKAVCVGQSVVMEGSDKACLDASILLTKLALARNSTDNVSVVVVGLRKNS